jgi:hypothetical protein
MVPHIWHTTDKEGGDVYHLAMSEDGAEQAHLIHHGMLGCDSIFAEDAGPLTSEIHDAAVKLVCFEPTCVLYGLMFE